MAKVAYNAQGQPYLVESSGKTVGPAPLPPLPPAASHPVTTFPAPAPEEKDPVRDWLETPVYAGVKWKYVLPVTVFLLSAIAMRGKRR